MPRVIGTRIVVLREIEVSRERDEREREERRTTTTSLDETHSVPPAFCRCESDQKLSFDEIGYTARLVYSSSLIAKTGAFDRATGDY